MTDLSPGEVVVTIKYGKGFDDPWAVFHGVDVDSVKRKIVDYFGMDAESLALSGHSVTVNARAIAQGMTAITDAFPAATVVSEEKPALASGSSFGGGDRGLSEPAPPAENPLIAKVEAVTSIPELQALWAENKAAFDTDPALMDAYKTKGKALSS